MRTIKFRVWERDIDENQTPIEMRYCQDFKECASVDENYGNLSVWMQCTGVKDKNGKEIYEGDILKVEEEYHHPDGRFITPGHYHVEYFIDGFGLYRKRGWWGLSDFSIGITNCDTRHAEVIGNVYENRDLLLKSVGV